jgi:hypothetical protein
MPIVRFEQSKNFQQMHLKLHNEEQRVIKQLKINNERKGYCCGSASEATSFLCGN